MSRARADTPPAPPRAPPDQRSSRNAKRRSRHRSHSIPRANSTRRRAAVHLDLCVFHSASHHWSTAPLRFDPDRVNDVQLWTDIRDIFLQELQKPWRRILGFKKVKSIVPIYYTPNGVPIRTDPKDYPDSKQFMHAFHRPESLRPAHEWVDWFVEFDTNDKRPNGLEFVEELWAEKLAAVAVLASVAIIVISIVWCVKGGNLQTVFTVMGFVLTFAAAEIALAALYYQVTLPG